MYDWYRELAVNNMIIVFLILKGQIFLNHVLTVMSSWATGRISLGKEENWLILLRTTCEWQSYVCSFGGVPNFVHINCLVRNSSSVLTSYENIEELESEILLYFCIHKLLVLLNAILHHLSRIISESVYNIHSVYLILNVCNTSE